MGFGQLGAVSFCRRQIGKGFMSETLHLFFLNEKIFLYSKYQKRMFLFRLAWLDEMKISSLRFFDIVRDGLFLY